MLFPIDDLLDDAACYRLLLSVLHPDGLHCPKGHPPDAERYSPYLYLHNP